MSAAPTLTRDWREQVRTLVAAGMSVRQAARELGLPVDRVRKFAERAKLCQTVTVAMSPMSPAVPTAAEILSKQGPDTRVKLSIAANKKATHLSEQDPPKIDSTELLQTAKASSVIYNWAQPSAAGPLVTLNFTSDQSFAGQIRDISPTTLELPATE